MDNYWLTAYGYIPEYNPEFHVLVNSELVKEHPKILSDSLVLLSPLTEKIEKNPPAVSGAPTHDKNLKKYPPTKLCDHMGPRTEESTPP